MGYGDDYYSWTGAFILGTILSCTDSLAILELQKEVRLPRKFN